MISLLRRLLKGEAARESVPAADRPSDRDAHFRARLQERCEAFRRLLSANKKALEAMSGMEESLAGQAPYTMGCLHAASGAVSAPVQTMIRELNSLTDNAYAALNDVCARLHARIAELLRVSMPDAGSDPLILPLSEVHCGHLPLIGGKMANLGEVKSRLKLPVPEGFAVTTAAYYAFMRHNNLYGEFAERLAATDMNNLNEVFTLSTALQNAILAASLPPELEAAITEAVGVLKARCGDDVLLALRSSAVGEDSLGVTFAGQYRSELNVPPDEACEVWKEIIAGKYAASAVTYRFHRGIPDEYAPMGVGVMAMVRAVAGGVAYSRDPLAPQDGPGQVVINAVKGLPKAVVDGSVTPDVFIFDRSAPPGPRCGEEGGACGSGVSADQARHIASLALSLEEHYGGPQDVEWAVDGEGRTLILQTRHLQQAPHELPEEPTPGNAPRAGAPVAAAGGVTVSRGVGAGPVFIVRKQADMLAFPSGGILVVEQALPRWATLLSRAAGLICESGGVAGHLASVAREYSLPALFSLKNACSLLQGTGEATLDADRAVIYAGVRPEHVAAGAKNGSPRAALMEGSPVQRRLRELGPLIWSLSLLDPDSAEFTPENCRSLHDITRFCHEKAARAMFDDEDGIGRRMGKQLKAGAKLQYWVIDMGGGFRKTVPGAVVDIADIASAPMLALWEGLTAVPWAGPPQAGAAGFMSVVFESAMNRELENAAPTVMTDRNFFIVSDSYMILQARYGYHLCTVECLAGDDAHENFVSFHFKGGAADRDRRKLRALMIASLLEEQGFRADVKNDALFAVAEGRGAAATLRLARLLGYLLIHTRQVDMIMRESARAKALEEKLRKDMNELTGRD
jgi:pyruvate,water dikinase